jgi:4-amino-4-deoxy-L-arabinose transferase-like glycosyltransferase
MNTPPSSHPSSPLESSTPWWREWEVGLLIVLVSLTYFSRLTTLPLRGEEPRWGMVAREILWTGDWIVPRQQGEPFLSRPPFGSYLMAGMATLLGDVTPLAIRFPAALATLLTTLLIYGYARQFLSRVGALGAALGYATMGQVLQLGQLAETEAVFTLLVSSSLLLWHWGYERGWNAAWRWSVAYLCVALGALAKGPQAPVYFATVIGAYLLWRRDLRALLKPAHFVGLAVFVAVLGAWQVPFALRLGWAGVEDIWSDDVGMRFENETLVSTLVHLVRFPLKVWVCLLPASLLLIAYLRPSFWRAVQPQRAWVGFLVIALLVTFPTCWIVPGAKARYYMPLYPCFAPLAGLVVEELLRDASRAWLVRLWSAFQSLVFAIAVLAGVAALGLAIAPGLSAPHFPWPRAAQPWGFALAFASATGIAAAWLWRQRGRMEAAAVRQSLVASTVILGMVYTGLVLNITLAHSQDAAAQMAEIERRLPEGARLSSFEMVDSVFTYQLDYRVKWLPMPKAASDVPEDVEYFCVSTRRGAAPDLPFAWRQEAVFSSDRFRKDQPYRTVIIGRRLEPGLAERPGDVKR